MSYDAPMTKMPPAQTNQMTPEQIAEARKLPKRADRRRFVADVRRQARYDETGHRDVATYVPFQPTNSRYDRGGIDDMGNPRHPHPFTPAELMARAHARTTHSVRFIQAALKSHAISVHESLRLSDRRAPHAQRSTAERPHLDRSKGDERRKLAFWTGVFNNANGLTANGKHDLAERYGHSSRTVRNQEAPLAMAA